MLEGTACKWCGRPLQRASGHRPRMYCKDAPCKQLASRTGQRVKRLQPLREQWSMLPQSTQAYLELVAIRYGNHAAKIAFDTLKSCFVEGNYHTVLTLYRLWTQEK